MESLLRPNPTLTIIKEYRVVSGASASVPAYVTELVGNQSSISITGLSGETDKHYVVLAKIINASTNDTQKMQFNGVTSNVYDYNYQQSGSTGGGSTGNAQPAILFNISSGGSIDIWRIDIPAQLGYNRQILSSTTRGGASNNSITATYTCGGVWRNSANAITSIQFGYSSVSNGYSVGTIIRLCALI